MKLTPLIKVVFLLAVLGVAGVLVIIGRSSRNEDMRARCVNLNPTLYQKAMHDVYLSQPAVQITSYAQFSQLAQGHQAFFGRLDWTMDHYAFYVYPWNCTVAAYWDCSG